MKPTRLLPAFYIAAALAFLFLAVARADQAVNSIKFSDPAAAKTLKINLGRGDLHLHGTDAAEVTVKSDAKAVSAPPRKDGLRVITSSAGFSLTEKKNLVVLDGTSEPWAGGAPSYDVGVPASVAVVVSNAWGGNIDCSNLTGDIEIKSLNGEVRLDNIVGGALVETMNGEISANVREVHEGKALSFTSTNGEIVIRVPDQTKANVRLRSQNGSILTDFDENVLVTKTENLGRSRRAPHVVVLKNGNASDASNEEINAAVHDAVRQGLDAARRAAEAIKSAAEAARDAAREAAQEGGPNTPLPPLPPMAPLPPMTGGKIVSGTLNGGGVEIQAATMNGDVTLRKSK